jgi:hypothetical protein
MIFKNGHVFSKNVPFQKKIFMCHLKFVHELVFWFMIFEKWFMKFSKMFKIFQKKLFFIFEIGSGFLKNVHDFLKVVYEF